MHPPRVLVTGASGNLGRVVRRALASRPDFDSHFAVGPRHSPLGVESTMDLRDARSITALVERIGPDIVIHLAGLVGPACDVDEAVTRAVNVDAVGLLATAAAAAGARRFVLASSAAVYGVDHGRPVTETMSLGGESRYAKSKIAAEQLLAELAACSDQFTAIALRIFNVYGKEFSDSLVERLLRSTSQEPVTISGADTFVRDYVHADDVAEAFIASCTAEVGRFTPLNIGSGEPLTTTELVERLSVRASIHVLRVDGAPSYSAAEIGAARTLLGFAPRPVA